MHHDTVLWAWRCSVFFNIGEMRVSDQILRSNRTISIPVCNGDESNLASCLSIVLSPWCEYLLVDCRDPVPQPLPPVIIPSDPTGTVVPDTATRDKIMRETPVIRESNTAQPEPSGRVRATEESSPVAVIAGIGGVVVVMTGLILLVSVMFVILWRKKRKYETNRYFPLVIV